MLFLLRAYTFQCTLTPASRQSRSVSPVPGDSTFTTSAPKSASCRLSMLPATSREKSSTRTPRSGPRRSGCQSCCGTLILPSWRRQSPFSPAPAGAAVPRIRVIREGRRRPRSYPDRNETARRPRRAAPTPRSGAERRAERPHCTRVGGVAQRPRRPVIARPGETSMAIETSAPATATSVAIPVIDLAPVRAGAAGAAERAAAALGDALARVGFFFVVGHGVPAELVAAVYREAERFHALPLADKLAISATRDTPGYRPVGSMVSRASAIDGAEKTESGRRAVPQARAEPVAGSRAAAGLPRDLRRVSAGARGPRRRHAAAVRARLRPGPRLLRRGVPRGRRHAPPVSLPAGTDLDEGQFGLAPHPTRAS